MRLLQGWAARVDPGKGAPGSSQPSACPAVPPVPWMAFQQVSLARVCVCIPHLAELSREFVLRVTADKFILLIG